MLNFDHFLLKIAQIAHFRPIEASVRQICVVTDSCFSPRRPSLKKVWFLHILCQPASKKLISNARNSKMVGIKCAKTITSSKLVAVQRIPNQFQHKFIPAGQDPGFQIGRFISMFDDF